MLPEGNGLYMKPLRALSLYVKPFQALSFKIGKVNRLLTHLVVDA